MTPHAVWARALALAGVVVAVDQASKALAESTIGVVHNKGVAFGLFGGASPVLIGITIVLLVLLLVYLAAGSTGTRVWLSAGLLVGGALGNLADRVRMGSVVDFIDVPLWPTFNLADVAIVAGVACLVLLPTNGATREA